MIIYKIEENDSRKPGNRTEGSDDKMATGASILKTVKLNSDIFSQAVAVMHNREVSLIELFTYELHFYPPSLANYGLMNFPKDKSDMVHELGIFGISCPGDSRVRYGMMQAQLHVAS